MSFFRACPHCGANLDPGERCNCVSSMYARLTPENKRKIDAFVHMLIERQKAALGAANTQNSGEEHIDHNVSTSMIPQKQEEVK